MKSNNHNENRESLPYLKLFPEEYLSSSLHYNCTLEAQGYFVGILAIAGKNRKDRGSFSLEKGQPMPDYVIAHALFIDIDTHLKFWKLMKEQDRIEQRDDGVWCIKNFEYYQNKYRRSHNATESARKFAINKSKEERFSEYAKQHPEEAKKELDRINKERDDKIQQLKDNDKAIEDLKDRAVNRSPNKS